MWHMVINSQLWHTAMWSVRERIWDCMWWGEGIYNPLFHCISLSKSKLRYPERGWVKGVRTPWKRPRMCELERACAVPMLACIPPSIQLTLHYLVQSAAEKGPSPLITTKCLHSWCHSYASIRANPPIISHVKCMISDGVTYKVMKRKLVSTLLRLFLCSLTQAYNYNWYNCSLLVADGSCQNRHLTSSVDNMQ